MAIFLAGISALLYGCADFAGGYAANKSKTLSVLIVSQSMGALLAVGALFIFWPGLPNLQDILWGFAAGLSGAFGLFMLYRGIALSIVAIVSPAAALTGAVLPLFFGMLIGERPAPVSLIGAAVCLPAIALLSWGSGPGGDRKAVLSALIQGLISGVGFAGFFIAVSRTGRESGFWPLIASRSASIAVAIAVAAATAQKIKIEKESRPTTISAGVCDMGANISFLLASRSGLLTLVSIIVALYPAPTVLLARVVFKERISLIRGIGLALTLVGVALISLK